MEEVIKKANSFLRATLEAVGISKWEEAQLRRDSIRVLIRLNSYCATLTQTVFQMLLDGCVWECEIIARVVSEGSIKLLFICGEKDEIVPKLQQYQDELIDYAYNKDSERATFYSENVNNASDIQKHIYSSMEAYKASFSKSRNERKRIEQKWSYLEMLSQIEKMGIPGIDSIKALAFGYGVSSHFVHADYAAIGMIWERESRSKQEYELITTAHKTRFISDLTTLAWMRAWILIRRVGNGEKDVFLDLTKKLEDILQELSQHSNGWEDFYRENYMPEI